jgi:ribose 5-phosphate isomerase A
MKQSGGDDEAKRRAGRSAAALPADGDVVGLGTGSTAAHAIRALGERVDAGLDLRGIPTSFQSRELAREAGVPLTSLDEASVDIAIDGADQVSDAGALVKGGGGAHAREKVVDADAEQFVVVADPSKRVERLDCPVPVEVLPDARRPVADAVEGVDGNPTLRAAERKDGPVVTDNGNLVLDCAFGRIDDPATLAATLAATPGVVAHGLFVDEADEVHVGSEDGVEIREF